MLPDGSPGRSEPFHLYCLMLVAQEALDLFADFPPNTIGVEFMQENG